MEKIWKIIEEDLNRILPIIGKFIKHKKILDIGCGLGLSAKFIATKIPCQISLIDIEDLRSSEVKDFPFTLGSADKLPFSNNSFDAVYIQFVLHHLQIDPINVLKEAHRVARYNTIIIEEIITKGINIKKAIKKDQEKNYFFHPGSSYPIQKFFSEKELQKIIKKSGWSIEEEYILPNKDYLPIKIYILTKICKKLKIK